MTNPLLDALAKPPPPPSELDELMARDPLDLSATDIDSIIAYHRDLRAKKAAGEFKTKRGKAATEESGIDLVALVRGVSIPKATPQPAPGTVPAVVSSFRRRL